MKIYGGRKVEIKMDIQSLIYVVSSLIGIVIWFVRLEGLSKFNNRMIDELRQEITELRTKHEALDSKIVEKLSVIEKSLAKIEGRLLGNLKGH